MTYIPPETVTSPKKSLSAEPRVLYNGGPGHWSAASLEFRGRERLALRWNGKDGEAGIGNPQSHGKPTWFVIPEELDQVVRARIKGLSEGSLL